MRRSFAAALVLLALASCTGGGKPKASRTPTSSPAEPPSATLTATPTPTATPSRFKVVDSTWVSADVGWVLGAATCGETECVSLKATRDGGRSWKDAALPTGTRPDRLRNDCQDPCFAHVRFANRKVGYLFGPGFYVTRDGGRTWHTERARLVLNLEISDGRAFRVVARMTGCPGPCDVRIERSVVGSRTWRELSTPRQDAAGTGLIVSGTRVYLAAYGNPAGGAGDAHPGFLRSLDAGRTWRKLADPCQNDPDSENDGIAIAAAPGGFLAVLCRSRMFSERRSFLMTSADSGRSFAPRRVLPKAFADEVAAGSGFTIAVAATRGARSVVLVSRDGGRTWRTTLSAALPEGDVRVFFGFQNASTARVALSGSAIWTTRDAGANWTRSDPF